MSEKSRAASISVASNSLLIAAKVAAGAITGSISIITEAAHSSIDLVASVIALVSVRKADEPPDLEHPYGHERFENFAAVIEGMLVIVGAGIIVYEATHRLVVGAALENLGVGIAVIAASAGVNDALTSLGVLVGLTLAEITGDAVFDSIAALAVAAAIVIAGVRILSRSGRALVDEAPPPQELDRIESTIAAERARSPQIVGYHKLRARSSGARRFVDLHLQFRSGTTLEDAHQVAHRLRDAIEAEFPASEVLIHVEPQESFAPSPRGPLRAG
jgi:divalent metal cation (Fe/Co/Zn/Cd) transporter